jgi:hypothetical protein
MPVFVRPVNPIGGKNMKKRFVPIAVAMLGASSVAHAVPTTQGEFDTDMDEFGVLTDYRAVAPAAPLGIVGFDLSVEGTSGTFEGNDVILPKIKFQKGLVAGLDISGYYTSIGIPTTGVSGTGYGAALSYAIWKGGVASPAWNIRGSYTTYDVPGVFTVNTMGLDTSISKGFGPITPYVGVGMVKLNGSDSSGFGFADYDKTKTRYFYGLSFDLTAFNLTLEGDSTDGTSSYSAKVGFRIGD